MNLAHPDAPTLGLIVLEKLLFARQPCTAPVPTASPPTALLGDVEDVGERVLAALVGSGESRSGAEQRREQREQQRRPPHPPRPLQREATTSPSGLTAHDACRDNHSGEEITLMSTQLSSLEPHTQASERTSCSGLTVAAVHMES